MITPNKLISKVMLWLISMYQLRRHIGRLLAIIAIVGCPFDLIMTVERQLITFYVFLAIFDLPTLPYFIKSGVVEDYFTYNKGAFRSLCSWGANMSKKIARASSTANPAKPGPNWLCYLAGKS